MNPSLLIHCLLPEAVLVLTALVVLGVALARETRFAKPVNYTAVSGMATVGILLAGGLMFTPLYAAVDGSLVTIDSLARVIKLIVLGLGLLAVWLPPAKNEIRHPGEFMALVLFALCGLTLTAGTQNLLMLFVALELASLSLYLLVGFPRTAKTSEVSLKYFLFGGVSAAFMLFGISLVYGFAHSVDLLVISKLVVVGKVPLLAMAGLVMVLVGIAFKLAAAPFHYWAPDVYQGGPATSVAIVSSASKVVGMVVLVRLLMTGFPAAAGSAAWGGIVGGWAVWIGVLAAVSMIFGNLLALAQTSVRRLLAYSAVANTGYLLVGVCGHGSASSGTALFYVVVYGLATLGALAITAAVERSTGSDHRNSFAGLVHRSPLQAVALLICLSSLAGIPPLAGFAGKFALFSKAMADTRGEGHAGLFWLVLIGAVMSAVSLYYYLSVLKQAFVKESDATAEKLSLGHWLAIGVPAAALVVLGIYPTWIMGPVMNAVAACLGS